MLCAEEGLDKDFFSSEPGSQCGMIHNDHLGTPQKMTDASGTVIWAADYKPFGEATITVSTITNNLRFPGQYFDAETGLHYNMNRVYNAPLGRYNEADRIGLAGGINLYSYAGDNPVKFIDPSGLYSTGDIGPAWDHYCDGSGTAWSTSFSSINWGNSKSRINDRIKGMVGGSCRDATIPVNFNIEAQTAGADQYIIGRHTLRANGTIKVNCDCSWSFSGSMSSALGYDPYDFDPSNRGPVGETLTWIGRNRCPNSGRSFRINITGSESLSFSGSIDGQKTCCQR